MKGNFSTDGGRNCSAGNVSDGGDGSGGNVSDGERCRAADDTLLAHPPAVHLLLCGPAPNRPPTGTRGWGP